MASHFSANQFQQEFNPSKLCNWQVPKWHPSRPNQRHKSTKILSNDRGHLLPGVPKPITNPWGNFKGTWQLPDKISKHEAFELNAPQTGQSRWSKPLKKKQLEQLEITDENKEDAKTFTPGDLTNPHEQHTSRNKLITQKNNEKLGKSTDYQLNDLYIESNHNCADTTALLNDREKQRRQIVPHVLDDIDGGLLDIDEMTREVTEKPGEKNTTPVVPAYCNFQVARKMAQENLEHQPLPDSIMDRAYRKLQAEGYPNPELALDVYPIATGVGIKTYMAGPTHCTKLKIYRPKTCGVVPKPLNRSKHDLRPHTSSGEKEKMGAMDLAIGWDYRPLDPRDEPKRPQHIDGSNGSVAPAVFTLVKTPRSPSPANNVNNTGRSGGVFANTLGEDGFFEKDIMRRKYQFGSKPDLIRTCTCGTSAASWQTASDDNNQLLLSSGRNRVRQHEHNRRCKSSPNLSQMAFTTSDNGSLAKENLYHVGRNTSAHVKMENNVPNTKHKHEHRHSRKCRRSKDVKSTRLCEQQQYMPEVVANRPKSEYKLAFKAGIPNSNSSGTCTSFDSGCGSSNNSSMSSRSCASLQKIVKIPKPRDPYAKKDYIIDTLAPPFACWRGGAGQGGYPEHWRLASVYQHAYKPVEQRKRPLLATVYQ